MVLCLPQDTGSFGSKVLALFEGAEAKPTMFFLLQGFLKNQKCQWRKRL